VRSVRSTGRGRFVLVSLGCPAGTRDGCTGRLAVALRRAGRRPLVLGRAAFAVAAGGRAVVRVRVSRGGRRALARPRRPRLAVTAEARDGAGSSRSTRAVVSLHRAR
jgi:hypothetical protein